MSVVVGAPSSLYPLVHAFLKRHGLTASALAFVKESGYVRLWDAAGTGRPRTRADHAGGGSGRTRRRSWASTRSRQSMRCIWPTGPRRALPLACMPLSGAA
jgi:hypothetical protein